MKWMVYEMNEYMHIPLLGSIRIYEIPLLGSIPINELPILGSIPIYKIPICRFYTHIWSEWIPNAGSIPIYEMNGPVVLKICKHNSLILDIFIKMLVL